MIEKGGIKKTTLMLFIIVYLCVQVSGCLNDAEGVNRHEIIDEFEQTEPTSHSVIDEKKESIKFIKSEYIWEYYK